MKKVLLILLILGVAGGLFAQGFTFNGYFDGGLGFYIPDSGNNRLDLANVDADSGANGHRARLIAAYTNASKNAGISLRLQGETQVNTWDTVFDYAYGWVSGFDGKVKLLAGKVDDSTWATNDHVADGDLGEGNGLLAIISPISGLNLGYGVYTNFGNQDWQAKQVVSAGFTAPDLVRVSFQYANRSNDQESANSGGYYWDNSSASWKNDKPSSAPSPSPENQQLLFSAGLLAVKGVTAEVVVLLENIQSMGNNDWDKKGNIGFLQTFGYTGIENLALYLNLGEYVTLEKNKNESDSTYSNKDFAFRAGVEANYTIGKIKPGIDLNIFSGGHHVFDGDYQHVKNYSVDFDNDIFTFDIQPSVQFLFDNNSWIELGYIVNIQNRTRSTNNSAANQAIYADLKVSF